MANPRKFSEKIALHNQKQAEETAAFEEIMREVMGATRNRTISNVAYNVNVNGNNPQQQQQQQPDQQQQHHLHIAPIFNATRAGSLPNVNQIGRSETNSSKGTCIDLRSALNNLQEIKNDVRSDHCRRNASVNRSPHRHHSSHNITSMAGQKSYNVVNQIQFNNSKRSQSPYSMNNNAYLSPPAADNQWRRTNSDSALHQSTLISTTNNMTNQTPDGFQQILTNNSSPQDSCNNSPGQTPAMIIDNTDNGEIIFSNSSDNNNLMNWDIARTMNNNSEKFLLSASLPDHQLRPRSCEVPGINIYPSQEENNSSDSNNHHHIPISSNTGSLPDLTNLHFPVPLNVPIDNDEQNIMKMNANNNNSPYSNGPDSPYSPASSHNSNLSPPPPCNMINNNYHNTARNQSPRRQQSPGPSPSPTASRRRAHHNANNMIMGNHRQQQQHAQTQFIGGAHRSTTPSDSCSAPTSPASQNISPSNSPELVINNSNGVQTTKTNQNFSPVYNSYSNQQANLLQHQLEQFRMNNDSDPSAATSHYVMACSANIIPQEPTNNQNANVFYLDSLTLSQFNETVMSQQFNPHQLTDQTTFTNDIFYDSSQSLHMNMQNDPFLKSELSNPMYNNNNNNTNSVNNQPHLSNSSHCTTPQTPSSIPDIILTGPNNLDETLQTSNDLIKDLNNMSSFDSDIFGTPNEDIRTGSFDSFDLDSLQILHDIETNHQ